MGVGHKEGLGSIDLHDANVLGHVIDIAVFSLLSDAVSALRIQRHTDRSSEAVTSTRMNSCVGSRRAGGLRTIGHERQDKTLEAINAILHIVRGASGDAVDTGLLARIGRGVETSRSVTTFGAVVAWMATIAFQPGRFVRHSSLIERIAILSTHFLCRHGAHDNGILFLLRTTRNWPLSGDVPFDELVVGGVGVMLDLEKIETILLDDFYGMRRGV